MWALSWILKWGREGEGGERGKQQLWVEMGSRKGLMNETKRIVLVREALVRYIRTSARAH